MKIFEVVKLGLPMPWTVQHKPTGLYAGSFHYRRHALAAAVADVAGDQAQSGAAEAKQKRVQP